MTDLHELQPMWLNFDLSEITERFRLKSPLGRLASDLEFEARRFLWLTSKSRAALIPSEPVDEYWHALILNTRAYRAYCMSAFGRVIEHENGVPQSSREALDQHLAGYLATLDAYVAEFGEPPPPDCWPTPVRRKLDRLKKYDDPYRIHVETTNHCNLRCEHCYPSSSSKNPHHAIATIDAVLEEARKQGVSKITLTGGELLTRPDWKDVVIRAMDICDNVYFITNGLLLTEATKQ